MRQSLTATRVFFVLTLLPVCLLLVASLSCVRLSRRASLSGGQTAPPVIHGGAAPQGLINLNTATPEELEKLPGIGKGLAARIIDFRAQFGRFRRAEHLIMVRGIGDVRFRALRALVTVE
ncbi:MAG TPA: helix-hairpin-helix domain-containing protein [Pyrinomonadaceae bacterium]|jgi:competence ComEA-like helix-hairpin-helix protein